MTDTEATQQTVSFSFEGRRMQGTAGEPLARAIFRNGGRTLSRSIKFHRPRGIYCARGRCVACLVQVNGHPGVKACVTPLRSEMRVQRQDTRPFFAPLLTAAIRLLPFPAGFYFRFFTRPAPLRRAFLGTLRRMAGVARVPSEPLQSDAVTKRRLPVSGRDARIIVIGGGVSGVSAATAAAADGANVLLIDAYAQWGGHSLGFQPDPSVRGRRDALTAAVARNTRISTLQQTLVHGYYDDNSLIAAPATGGGLTRFLAGTIIFATGASDALPLFENNDTPGIFGAHAIRLLLERDRWIPGQRAIVYGTAADVETMAALLRHHDITVTTMALHESSENVSAQNARVVPGARLRSVHGRGWIAGARFDTSSGSVRADGEMLCIATPCQPSYELPYQAGFRYQLSDTRDPFAVLLPTADRLSRGSTRCFLAGSAAGVQGWNEKIDQAAAVGHAAAAAEAARHHG